MKPARFRLRFGTMSKVFMRDLGNEEHSGVLMPMQENESTKFDPTRMQMLAEGMIADGTMPTEKALFAAMERIREKYAERILKAREQDQRGSSSETLPSTPKS